MQGRKNEYDVAIDADDLDNLDEDALKLRYAEKEEENDAVTSAARGEIVDMMEEHERRNKRKATKGLESKSKRMKDMKNVF